MVLILEQFPFRFQGRVLLPDRAGAAGRVRRDPSPDHVLPAAADAQAEAKDHLPPLHRVPLPLQRIPGAARSHLEIFLRWRFDKEIIQRKID